MSTDLGDDVYLREYGKALSNDIVVRIKIEHQFLALEEEARLEQQSFFTVNRDHNTSVLSNLMSSVELVGNAASGKDADHVENAIIVSVGTSSTQVFCNRGVIMARYIGHSSLIERPELAKDLLVAIFTELTKHGINSGVIILCNAIGYVTNTHLLLNSIGDSEEALVAYSNKNNLLEARKEGVESSIAREEFEYSQQSKVMHWLASAARCSNPSAFPVILQCRSPPKFRYGWLELQALYLLDSKASSMRSCRGIYVVDFGGGGPVLSYCSSESRRLEPITKDRSFRKLQLEFIAAMSQTNFEASPLFTKLVKFLRKNILLHALSNEPVVEEPTSHLPSRSIDLSGEPLPIVQRDPISLSENEHSFDNEEILCFVLQTGKARQQHFLGHVEPQDLV